ncbi:MAG: cobalt-precorrin-5B (C(1))-methyltransferase CbiD [Leptolyngbyaceae cyanobacterium]
MSVDSISSPEPRAGFTLPVFACASAMAAVHKLRQPQATILSIQLDLLEPKRRVDIPIEQVAALPDGSALAITRSDPGDNLDLTRNTPIWAMVRWGQSDQQERIHLEGGEGVGRQVDANHQSAIYAYAQRLLTHNLTPYLADGETLSVTIILPEGRSLALRTSNAAFGVVDGLSLLGTSGLSEPLSAPGQLAKFRTVVRDKAQQFSTLVFCVGENGLQLALTLGVPSEQRVKTGNWIGPLLVEAALCGLPKILLLGYHGKLIKLAGGIFHTHHYVADGRQEILSAIAAAAGLPTAEVQRLLQSETLESGLRHLRQVDAKQTEDWVSQIYQIVVERIDQRSQAYIRANADRSITVGSAVFDRQREIVAMSGQGRTLLKTLLVS